MNSTSRTRSSRRGRLAVFICATVLATAGVVTSAAPAQAANESITVNFSVAGGSPSYRASGWIYGMTEDGSGPPDQFYRDVKFRYMRAGGAQLDGPGGWVSGKYQRRWNATVAQARRTIALGGQFVLLPHDLWGADGYPISRFPGDNGDWTDYDNFLTRLISDIQAAGITVQWDIWNEPNLGLFWNRPQAQYFELWRRTYQRVRSAFPSFPIVGPSCACVPSTTHAFWNQYLDYIKANNVVPDTISWHSLPGDPVANVAAANTTLGSRGIAHPRPYQINEYGASNEQNPGDGSWYIARLERAGADGLRANWASGGNLHNDLGNLLVHSGAQYQPKGEWWVYRFYGSQTGTIASVTPSQSYDAFATKDTGNAKILIGGGRTTGNIAVNIQNLNATTGIVVDNRVRVVVNRIPNNNGGAVAGPVLYSNTTVTLSNNATTVNVPNNDINDTYTIELLPPGQGPVDPWERVTSRHSGLVMDVSGVSTADGALVHQWQWLSGSNQQWQFRDAGGGYFSVVARHSGKCLDVSGVSTADGAAVHQWTCTGGQNQQWQWVSAADGYYTLRARHSGKCLDVSGSSTSNGGSLVQWTCTGAANQQWSRSTV